MQISDIEGKMSTIPSWVNFVAAVVCAILAINLLRMAVQSPRAASGDIRFVTAEKSGPIAIATKMADGRFFLYGKEVTESEFNSFLSTITLNPNGASIGSNKLEQSQ